MFFLGFHNLITIYKTKICCGKFYIFLEFKRQWWEQEVLHCLLPFFFTQNASVMYMYTKLDSTVESLKRKWPEDENYMTAK